VNLLDGIWIHSSDAIDVPLEYSQAAFTSMPAKQLYSGWNSIGFSYTQPLQARDSLVSIQEQWLQVIGFDSSTQSYQTSIVKNGTGSHSDTNHMYPLKGYWVKMNSNGTFLATSY